MNNSFEEAHQNSQKQMNNVMQQIQVLLNHIQEEPCPTLVKYGIEKIREMVYKQFLQEFNANMNICKDLYEALKKGTYAYPTLEEEMQNKKAQATAEKDKEIERLKERLKFWKYKSLESDENAVLIIEEKDKEIERLKADINLMLPVLELAVAFKNKMHPGDRPDWVALVDMLVTKYKAQTGGEG